VLVYVLIYVQASSTQIRAGLVPREACTPAKLSATLLISADIHQLHADIPTSSPVGLRRVGYRSQGQTKVESGERLKATGTSVNLIRSHGGVPRGRRRGCAASLPAQGPTRWSWTPPACTCGREFAPCCRSACRMQEREFSSSVSFEELGGPASRHGSSVQVIANSSGHRARGRERASESHPDEYL